MDLRNFLPAVPEELTFGETCPRCERGKVPLWNGVIIYPYCGGCAIIMDDARLRREQDMQEQKMRWEQGSGSDNSFDFSKVNSKKSVNLDQE